MADDPNVALERLVAEWQDRGANDGAGESATTPDSGESYAEQFPALGTAAASGETSKRERRPRCDQL